MDLLNFESCKHEYSRRRSIKLKCRVPASVLAFLLCIDLAGCHMTVAQVDKGTRGAKTDYAPLMYQERPVSIAVLPIAYAGSERKMRPATERLFVEAVSDSLKQNGYTVVTCIPSVSEGPLDMDNLPLQKYRDDCGADAVLYMICRGWRRLFAVDGYQITGAMLLVLKSTRTGQVLWTQGIVVCRGSAGIAAQIMCQGGGDHRLQACCLGLLTVNVALVIVQHQTGLSRYVPNADEINETMQLALKSMPYGKFHERYGKDMDDSLPYQYVDREKDRRRLQKDFAAVSDFFAKTLNKIKQESKRLLF